MAAAQYDSDVTYCSEAEMCIQGFRKSQRLSQKPAHNYKELSLLKRMRGNSSHKSTCQSVDILEATEMQICSDVLPLNQNATHSSSQKTTKMAARKRPHEETAELLDLSTKKTREGQTESNVQVLVAKNDLGNPAKQLMTTGAGVQSTPRENIENIPPKKRTQTKRKPQTRKKTPKVKSAYTPLRRRPRANCASSEPSFHSFNFPSAPASAPAGLNSVRESMLPSVYPPHFIYQLPAAPAAMTQPQPAHTDWNTYLTPEFTQSVDLDMQSTSSPSLPESLRWVFDTDDIREVLHLERYSYRLTEGHVRALAVVLNLSVDFMHQVLNRVCQFSSNVLEQFDESLSNVRDSAQPEANSFLGHHNSNNVHDQSPDRLSTVEGSQSPQPRRFISQSQHTQRRQL